MISNAPDDLIPAAEAAQLLGCHVATIYRWAQTGRLQGWRRGSRHGRLFVSRADLLGLFQPQAAAPQLVESPAPRRATRASQELDRIGM